LRTILAWIISGLLVGTCFGCSDDDHDKRLQGSSGTGESAGSGGSGPDDQEATCESLVNALTDCDLLTGTRLAGCEDDEPSLPCMMVCIGEASCEELEARYCYLEFNRLAECLEDCQAALPSPEFVCDDRSRIPASFQCDGAEDCSKGEDEDCPEGRFSCDGGLSIPAAWQCDGVEDCPNGEDELACSGDRGVICDDGSRLPASRECDGKDDCPEGEDEVDCARLICE
jgi:hypothetical protein